MKHLQVVSSTGEKSRSKEKMICKNWQIYAPNTCNHNRGDWDSIRRDLHTIAWKPLLEDKTCEEQLKIFMELIEQQVDRRIPWKRQRGKHTPRWMNKRMQKCIRRKRKKWKKFKDSGRQEDYLAFKVIQSQTTSTIILVGVYKVNQACLWADVHWLQTCAPSVIFRICYGTSL